MGRKIEFALGPGWQEGLITLWWDIYSIQSKKAEKNGYRKVHGEYQHQALTCCAWRKEKEKLNYKTRRELGFRKHDCQF